MNNTRKPKMNFKFAVKPVNPTLNATEEKAPGFWSKLSTSDQISFANLVASLAVGFVFVGSLWVIDHRAGKARAQDQAIETRLRSERAVYLLAKIDSRGLMSITVKNVSSQPVQDVRTQTALPLAHFLEAGGEAIVPTTILTLWANTCGADCREVPISFQQEGLDVRPTVNIRPYDYVSYLGHPEFKAQIKALAAARTLCTQTGNAKCTEVELKDAALAALNPRSKSPSNS